MGQSRTSKTKPVQMASHFWHECEAKRLAICTGFGLDALLSYVVEHVFVINLVYWMLGFDAGTA